MTRNWCNLNLSLGFETKKMYDIFVFFSDQFNNLLLRNHVANQLEAKFCVKPSWVGKQKFVRGILVT